MLLLCSLLEDWHYTGTHCLHSWWWRQPSSSETSAHFHHTTWYHTPKDSNFQDIAFIFLSVNEESSIEWWCATQPASLHKTDAKQNANCKSYKVAGGVWQTLHQFNIFFFYKKIKKRRKKERVFTIVTPNQLYNYPQKLWTAKWHSLVSYIGICSEVGHKIKYGVCQGESAILCENVP
jgi:hypothetical protein